MADDCACLHSCRSKSSGDRIFKYILDIFCSALFYNHTKCHISHISIDAACPQPECSLPILLIAAYCKIKEKEMAAKQA